MINLTLRNQYGHIQTLSGTLAYTGEKYIIIVDQDGLEHPFKRSQIVEMITL